MRRAVVRQCVGEIGRHGDLARGGVGLYFDIDLLAGGDSSRGAVLGAQRHQEPATPRRDRSPVGMPPNRDAHRGPLP